MSDPQEVDLGNDEGDAQVIPFRRRSAPARDAVEEQEPQPQIHPWPSEEVLRRWEKQGDEEFGLMDWRGRNVDW